MGSRRCRRRPGEIQRPVLEGVVRQSGKVVAPVVGVSSAIGTGQIGMLARRKGAPAHRGRQQRLIQQQRHHFIQQNAQRLTIAHRVMQGHPEHRSRTVRHRDQTGPPQRRNGDSQGLSLANAGFGQGGLAVGRGGEHQRHGQIWQNAAA